MAKAANARRGTKAQQRATTRAAGGALRRTQPSIRLYAELHHPKKEAFLAAYVETASTRRAAKASGIERKSHWLWLRDDPAYVAAFERAREMAICTLEDEATERAMGWEEPIFHEGEQVGTRRKYSDTLLIFRLNGEMPSKYRTRSDVTHDLSPAMAALMAEWDASAARHVPTAAEPPSLEAEWAPMLPGEEGEMEFPIAPEPTGPPGPPPGMTWPPQQGEA